MLSRILPPHLNEDDLSLLLENGHPDPFSVLGVHKTKGKSWLVAMVPNAVFVTATMGRKVVELTRLSGPVFAAQVPNSKIKPMLTATYDGGAREAADPYSVGPVLGDVDL
ncbi:MAG: hypothetical protein AAF714_08130, partial [Pseudomonadota bacterium]